MAPQPDALRVVLYDEIIGRGRWPTLDRIASHFKIDLATARASLAALKIGKTVLVDPKTGELWMAGPFSGRATPYRVTAGGHSWWANCAWDMLGIVALVGKPARIETRCTDCGEPIQLAAEPATGVRSDAVVHFLVPARQWYDDIGYT